MLKINSRIIALLGFLIYAVAISLSFVFKSYELAVSGMLIAIFLTAFIPGRGSTLLTGLVSMIVLTGLVIFFKDDQVDIRKALLSQIYSLLVILFSVVLIFYLKRLQQSVSYGKVHMTSLFENATEGIIVTNGTGKIVLANPSVEKMFGYDSNELTGYSIEVLLPKRFQHGHVHFRNSFLQSPSNRSMGKGRDLFAARKDETEFPVEISLSHYKQGNDIFVIAFIVDITARKVIENKSQEQREELEKISDDIRKLNTELEKKVDERTKILKEALAQLEHSQKELHKSLEKEKHLNEIKSRFVSMASHEFRTPLSTILSSATLVSKYPNTEEIEKREKHIRKIKDSVGYMNELLEDFLSLGKLEEGKVIINSSRFCLADFIEDIEDEMKIQLKKGQEIISTTQGEAFFETDKRMLKNIILNLLSNAIKFSPEGSPIDLLISCEADSLDISIQDRGLGIPEEDQPFLFSTFFRAKNVMNIQGTGLGLPIVKRYTDLLGGTISFKSREGFTSFSVILPKLESTA